MVCKFKSLPAQAYHPAVCVGYCASPIEVWVLKLALLKVNLVLFKLIKMK